MYRLLLLISLIANGFAIDAATLEIMANYFAYRNVELVRVFHCWSLNDVINMEMNLHRNFIRCSSMDIQEVINEKASYNQTTNFIFYEKHGYIMDLNCPNGDQFLQQNMNYNKWLSRFSNTFKWIILNRSDSCDSVCLQNIFRNVKLRLDSDIVIMNEENEHFKFYDIYSTGKGGKLIVQENIGYNLTKGKFTSCGKKNIGKYALRKNLLGHTVRTVTVVTKNISMPAEEYLISPSLQDEAMNKYHFVLYLHLKDIHNFNILLFTTNAWFGPSVTGIDGGMTKYLWNDEADFAATSGIMTQGRVLAIDYFMATYKFGSCFIFRNPTAIGRIRNQFFDPFTTNIWYVCLFFGVVFCVFIHATYKIHKYLGEDVQCSWSSSILNTWAAFCQQDIEIDGHNFTARTLILSLMVLSLLLYNYYTSSIVSDLINSRTQAFTTLGELIHSSLDLGMEEIGYVYRLFNGSTDSDVQYLRNKIIEPGKPKKFYAAKEGIALMQKGQFAYHVEPATGYPIIAKTFDGAEICDLCEIYVYPLSNIYVLTQKLSQYKKMFAISYRKMSEHGIMNRQRLIWQAQKPECLSSANILQIELEQVAPAFIVLLFGVVSSLIILLLEIRLTS